LQDRSERKLRLLDFFARLGSEVEIAIGTGSLDQTEAALILLKAHTAPIHLLLTAASHIRVVPQTAVP